MEIIYDDIKTGRIPPAEKLYQVAEPLFAAGCDCAILGCTELSLMQRTMPEDRRFVDSLAVLAAVSIRLMGHETVGFPDTEDTVDPARFRESTHSTAL